MHIGMMADLYHPHVSGVTHAIDMQRRALRAAGHQASVFHFNRQEDHQVDTIRSNAIWLPLTASGIPIAGRLSRRARGRLAAVDVLHLHHPFMSASLGMPAAAAAGVPLLFSHHTRYDRYAESYLPPPLAQLARALWRVRLHRLSRRLAVLIAPSRQLQDELVRANLDCPVVHIPNGIDCSRFGRGDRGRLRIRLGLAAGDVLCLYVGRIGPEKNLSLLLRAFAVAAADDRRLHLAFVGEGTQAVSLRRKRQQLGLTKAVHFTGAVPYGEMPDTLAAADVVVTASTTEVMPLSLLEAMAAGKPIVALRAPGAIELVEHRKTGLLAESSAHALGYAIVELSQSPTDRIALGERSRLIAQRFDIHRLVKSWLRLYRTVASDTSLAGLAGLRLTDGEIG